MLEWNVQRSCPIASKNTDMFCFDSDFFPLRCAHLHTFLGAINRCILTFNNSIYIRMTKVRPVYSAHKLF